MKQELSSDTEVTKLEKKVGRDYTEDLRAMAKDDLEARLLQLAKYRQEIQTSKKNDEELEAAKDRVSFLSGPYRDALKDNDLKSRLVTLIMAEKGYE